MSSSEDRALACQWFDADVLQRVIVASVGLIGVQAISYVAFGRGQPLLFAEQFFLVPMGMILGVASAMYTWWRLARDASAYAALQAASTAAGRLGSIAGYLNYAKLRSTTYHSVIVSDAVVRIVLAIPLVLWGFHKALLPLCVCFGVEYISWRLLIRVAV